MGVHASRRPSQRGAIARRVARGPESRSERRLTTTALAILGLIAVKPGTAYELAKRMQRNYRYVWPRAESKLYEAVKRLVAEGAATAKPAPKRGKRGTFYEITAEGRALLRAWIDGDDQVPGMEFEALLKVTYGDFGSKEALLRRLQAVKAHAEAMRSFGVALASAYATGSVELVERTPMNGLVWRFLWEHYGAMANWADWAVDEVSAWPAVTTSTTTLARMQAMFAREVRAANTASRDRQGSPPRARATKRTGRG